MTARATNDGRHRCYDDGGGWSRRRRRGRIQKGMFVRLLFGFFLTMIFTTIVMGSYHAFTKDERWQQTHDRIGDFISGRLERVWDNPAER